MVIGISPKSNIAQAIQLFGVSVDAPATQKQSLQKPAACKAGQLRRQLLIFRLVTALANPRIRQDIERAFLIRNKQLITVRTNKLCSKAYGRHMNSLSCREHATVKKI